MNVLIVNTNRNRLPFPVMPAGACAAAQSAAQAGHSVRFLDLMFEKNPVRSLRDAVSLLSPDVVGLSIRNIDNNDLQSPVLYIRDARVLIDTIRSATDAVIVIGGAAIAVMPEEIMRYTGADIGVLGSDALFTRLLARLSAGKPFHDLEGLVWMEDGSFRKNASGGCGMESAAVPDFGRWVDTGKYLSAMATVPLQSKLGCHFHCVYCTYRKIQGSAYRLSDPGGVSAAVCGLRARGFQDIEFVDNVFNSPYAHAVAVCESLIRENADVRLHSLELNPLFLDDHLLGAMKKAGFRGIGITVESASDRVLEGLKKGFTAGDVHRAAGIVRRHDIPCTWIFMFGGPGETSETVRETLDFAGRYIRKTDVAFFTTGIRIYPGTELEAIARGQGILSLSPGEMLEPVFYVSPHLDPALVQGMIRRAMAGNMNFISSESIGLSFLPAMHGIAYRMGIRPPLWRYTRFIRRTLRLCGVDA